MQSTWGSCESVCTMMCSTEELALYWHLIVPHIIVYIDMVQFFDTNSND